MVNLKGSAGKWLLVTYSHRIGMEGLRELLKTSDSLFGIWDLLNMVDNQLQYLVLPSNILHFFQGWTVDWADHGTHLLVL